MSSLKAMEKCCCNVVEITGTTGNRIQPFDFQHYLDEYEYSGI